VPKGFACGFFGRVKSREALCRLALAQRVGHLFVRVDFAREPREFGLVETVARNLGQVGSDADDHSGAVSRLRRKKPPQEMEMQLRIVPVNGIDPAFLSRLGLCLAERFLYDVVVERSLSLSRSCLNSTRKQLFLPTLTTRLLREYGGDGGLLLGITDFDLYKTSQRFVFGDADEHRRVAAVSLHRLRNDFYGEASDENALFQRTLKECVHELGHALGLKHCYNARCAMHYSNSIFETDNKMPHFCEVCEKRSRARSEG